MKIKSIAAICKKNKNIAIFERYSDDGDILTQYIGDGSAVYPVVGLPQLSRKRGGVSDCFTYPSADGHGIFSRLHLRESGNPLRARAATVHGRRRERRRSRALPFNGSYL